MKYSNSLHLIKKNHRTFQVNAWNCFSKVTTQSWMKTNLPAIRKSRNNHWQSYPSRLTYKKGSMYLLSKTISQNSHKKLASVFFHLILSPICHWMSPGEICQRRFSSREKKCVGNNEKTGRVRIFHVDWL